MGQLNTGARRLPDSSAIDVRASRAEREESKGARDLFGSELEG
jgi:hypothetical protein